jgi:nucleotide-binding universal stress UspA family protein
MERIVLSSPRALVAKGEIEMNSGPVLVATDFSEQGDDAIREADAWARRAHTSLIALHVMPPLLGCHPLLPQLDTDDVVALPRLLEEVREALAARVQALTHRPRADLDVEIEIDQGRVASRILNCATASAASLIVLGASTKDALGHALLGSTSEHVIRDARVPVLIARGRALGPVLAAVDMSGDTVLLLAAAAKEASRRDATLMAVHSIEPRRTTLFSSAPTPSKVSAKRLLCERQLRAALRRSGAGFASPIVADGPAAASIVQAVHAVHAGLVVVGTHARAEEPAGFAGSVAQALARKPPCSVLVVHLPS